MLLPALFAVVMGVLIVFIGRYTLAKLPKVKTVDCHCDRGLVRCREWLYPRRCPDGTGRARHQIRVLGRRTLSLHGHPSARDCDWRSQHLSQQEAPYRRRGSQQAGVSILTPQTNQFYPVCVGGIRSTTSIMYALWKKAVA